MLGGKGLADNAATHNNHYMGYPLSVKGARRIYFAVRQDCLRIADTAFERFRAPQVEISLGSDGRVAP